MSPQVAVDEIDNMVRGHFERAKQLLADERWDDAIDVVSRSLENDGITSWWPQADRSA